MTRMNYKANLNTKEGASVNVFSKDELQQIHYATLRVMRETGVKIYNAEALNVFEDGGCIVDRSTGIVQFPNYVVEESVASAPSSILLAGRDPKHDTVLEGNRAAWTNFGCGVKMYDAFTGELKLPTILDVAHTAKVVDCCENVDVYSQAVVARDAPDNEDLYAAKEFLINTSKHCHHIDLISGENAKRYIEMAAAMVDDDMDELRRRPLVSALICPTSPLQMSDEGCKIITEFALAGIPINVLSMALSGGTSPITLDGTLVVHNCEVLAGIVLAQLVSKGAPVLYGSSTTTFDMKCVTAPVGSPELGMINAGVAELAQFYKIPSYTAGG